MNVCAATFRVSANVVVALFSSSNSSGQIALITLRWYSNISDGKS
jgi:hypothetical protein